jgi:hypothetical protein
MAENQLFHDVIYGKIRTMEKQQLTLYVCPLLKAPPGLYLL